MKLITALAMAALAITPIAAPAQCSSGNCGSMQRVTRYIMVPQQQFSQQQQRQSQQQLAQRPTVQAAPATQQVRDMLPRTNNLILLDEAFANTTTSPAYLDNSIITPVSFMTMDSGILSPLQEPAKFDPVQAPFQKHVQAPVQVPVQKSWDTSMMMDHSYMDARARPVRRGVGILRGLFGGRRGSCGAGGCN